MERYILRTLRRTVLTRISVYTALLALLALAPMAGVLSAASSRPRPVNGRAQLVSQTDGDITDDEVSSPGPHNVVQVDNHTDGTLRLRGRIQLAHAHGQADSPLNRATAYGTCVECSTFAVALQIVLVERTATISGPVNVAIALNDRCTGCVTVADAYQFIVPVDDPDQVPDNVNRLIHQLDGELRTIAHEPGITATDAEADVNAVIGQFTDLALDLYVSRDQDTRDTTPGTSGTPTPLPEPTSAAAPVPTDTPQPADTAPAATATPTPVDSATPTSTPTPSPSPTARSATAPPAWAWVAG